MIRSARSATFALLLLAVPLVGRAEAIGSDWVAKWRADLAFMADSLPLQHPNFFHSVTRAEYRGALDSLSRRLPQLEQHQVVVELGRIVAKVGDGHTRVTFPFDPAAGFFTGHTTTAAPKIPDLVFRHYPIRLGLFGDSLWVIRADSSHRDLLGGRVTRIGRMTADQAIAAVAPTIQRDNDRQVRDLLPTWLVCPEVLEARGVVGSLALDSISVERIGRTFTAPLVPVAPGADVRWFEARDTTALPLRDRYPTRAHWFTQIQGSRTFYARYREVRDDPGDAISTWADSLFAAIDTAGGDRLVIDARGNVGGNGFLNGPLVQHVIRAEKLWQPGGLWLLTDCGTFSAAIMLAADLERWTPVIIAGEKTGGHPNSYGDSKRVVLPNSGITVRVSSLYWQLTGPNDPRDGFTPLVPVESRWLDWRVNRDAVLDAALARGSSTGTYAGLWKGEIGWRSERVALSVAIDFAAAVWSVHITSADMGLNGAPADFVRVDGPMLTASWTAGNETWRMNARFAGPRLVGVVRYKGYDFPIVLERAPR